MCEVYRYELNVFWNWYFWYYVGKWIGGSYLKINLLYNNIEVWIMWVSGLLGIGNIV